MTIDKKPDIQSYKPRKGQLLLAVLSGVLLTLAFPKADQGWLAWVALVPLLLALRKAHWRQGLTIGFSAGWVHYLGLMYWTTHTMHVYGHLPLYQSVFILLLFAGTLALYTGLFGLLLTRMKPRPWQLPVVAPMVWVAVEMLRSVLFTGFPWELLGYSQYDHLWILQWADLFGVYGLSALIVMMNSVVVLGMLHWIEKPWQEKAVSPRLMRVAGAMALGTLVVVVAYGALRLRSIDKQMAQAPMATVAVIQGNIDQAQKWAPSFQLLSTVKYKNLSAQAAAQAPDLIVWPETATPFYFTRDPLLSQMVLEGIKETAIDYIIGSPSAVVPKDGAPITYRNSAYLVSAQGKILGQYDKVHLVPFGEYVPLKPLLPFIDKLVAQVGDFKPGQRGATLPWQTHPIGMQICYESIFPGLVRSMVQNGAQVLVNITNDAWFDRTSAAYQHFSMAVFRAVENRRAMVRAANTGISGFIDPSGRIVATTDLFEDAYLVSPVAMMDHRSYYSRWGDWPALFVVLILLVPWMAKEIIKWRRSRGEMFHG
jgi:apolipoprotein N-acyltransferase